LQWYTVRKGESLPTIARRLRVSRADLAEANYLNSTARVQPGQRLVVPRAPSAALLAGRANAPAVATRVADAEPEPREAEVTRTVYRVRKGDTLYSIARRHGVSVENLRAWNRLKGSALSIGDRLQIQTARSANAQ
jgi:membrane-bound lytic murein transglycosylase D